TRARLLADTGREADTLALELGDLGSVRRAAEEWLARGQPLHVLIDNAGLAGTPGLTPSGFELAFGTNHVGTFLFTTLLVPRLRESAPSRVVVVASRAHYDAPGIDWDAIRRRTSSLTGMPEYRVSKLANVLFAAELGRRLEGSGVATASLHPGVVATDVWRRVPWPASALMKLAMISPEDGARTSLHCATSPEIPLATGAYWSSERQKQASAVARDASLAAELYRRSEEWTAGA
ncbi:MAG: SDR family NAD(P)-dependent oxidoreductase, partial [Deltaproteobacteria bacterium]|nr:SDR family NAD(P)-dependent oxidoreductase [Deltaproteobacteria bacterium]